MTTSNRTELKNPASNHTRPNRTERISVWRMPLLLGLLTIVGIGSALLGTGVWHWVSWAALAVPVIVIGWHLPHFLSQHRD